MCRMVDNLDCCIFCGSHNVEIHHVFFGTGNRQKSDIYGFVVPLCNKHHTGGGDCPHRNRIIDLALKCWGQSVFEKELGTRQDFRNVFGKSYL